MMRGRLRVECGGRRSSRQIAEPLNFAAEPAPCDDCPHAAMCRAHQLACKAFAAYVRTGCWKASQRRLPNPRAYRRLFGGRPDHNKRERQSGLRWISRIHTVALPIARTAADV